MIPHTQHPVALILEPDAKAISLWQRMVESLVAAVRPATQVQEAVQSSAKPFSIAHPWRRWHWFS